jgi:hypothetical protein
MKKLAFLLVLCSFSNFVNAGHEELLLRSTSDAYGLLGTSKLLIVSSIKRIHSEMAASPLLRPYYVQIILSANAALKEGVPAQEFGGRSDGRTMFYPVSFPALLDIWGRITHTQMGRATWQFLADVLHANITLYKLSHENVLVPMACLRSARLLEQQPREYHIARIQTQDGERYALINPPQKN